MLLWQDTNSQELPEPQRVVLTIRVEGDAITPVTARLVRRAIEEAIQRRAECLVIFLDTPGGFVESTREIAGAPEEAEGPIQRGTPMEDEIVNDTAAWARRR